MHRLHVIAVAAVAALAAGCGSDPKPAPRMAAATPGALAGRSMLLTGRTDARGEVEDIALGQRRAGRVAGYLAGRDLPRAHLGTISHGEFDATDTDEAGWARDRKVDVTLVE